MNGVQNSGKRHVGIGAMLLLSAVSLRADPITIDELPVLQPATIIPITLAILAEAICLRLLLRRARRPRLFILWVMGMHLLTYPIFLGILWLSYGLHPALGVTLGEGLIVLLEGSFIYLICRFLASAKSTSPVPSMAWCMVVSLLGNICSAAVFPLLLVLFSHIGHLPNRF